MLATEAEATGGSQLWSCYSVLNVLYSLVQKSRINEYLVGVREGLSEAELAYVPLLFGESYSTPRRDITGEYGSKPLYRMLGYFSLIGLLRVHVLLGDFTLALKVMENIELNQKARLLLLDELHPYGFVKGLFHKSDCVSCGHVLLRRLLLHGITPLQRRHSNIRIHPQFHWSYETVPHSLVPVRPSRCISILVLYFLQTGSV